MQPKFTVYLATVNIIENAYVHKDDVLATIAPRDFEIALAQALARLDSQKAAIGTIVEQITAAEASAESAKATISSADAQARRAKADYARYTQQIGRAHV